MKKFLFWFLILAGLNLSAFPAELPATAVIDWNRTDGHINRAIFSTQGFMQVYVCEDPMVMETFKLLNPTDTQTRLETYIHHMEPENDNNDPYSFNWDKFHPNRMIRFIEDREPFEKVVDELGMHRLFLACYLVDWLKSDNPDVPIKDVNEWAEYTASVIETYNGSGENYRPRLRYVEIWNEPNMEQFYTGTMESYFHLFNTTADRIHRQYPGVMVGGPALTHAWHCQPEEWMQAFMKACAPKADFISYHHYGPQGEGVDVLTSDIKKWVNMYRAIPGKEQGKVMLTELDAWFSGWPKADYMMERQFRFLDISDLILGIHHFCCMAYNEAGNYTFGIVDTRGGVIEGTFWPYWIFRNLIGNEAYSLKQGSRYTDFDLAASHYTKNGQMMATAVYHNRKQSPLEVPTLLYFPASDKNRVLTLNRIAPNYKGVEKALLVPAGTDKMPLSVKLGPGEAVSVNLVEPGKRIFDFRDLNNQETPWIGLSTNKDTLNFAETAILTVSVLNTTLDPVSGKLGIRALPEGWEAVPVGPTKISKLEFGETHTTRFQVKVNGIAPGGFISPYVVLEGDKYDSDDLDSLPHSIPASIKIVNPVKTQILPLPVFGVPGESNQVTLQITNMMNRDLECDLSFEAPEGCRVIEQPGTFGIPAGKTRRAQFPFKIEESASPGIHKGTITLNYLGTVNREEYTVEIVEGAPVKDALALDLSPWLNIDAAAYFTNRKDYTSDHIGMFVYPADFTPSDRVINIRGVPYRFAPLEDGNKNAILPQGQKLEVPEGNYSGISFIGYGHDGKHHGDWYFHYGDGTAQRSPSQIPEWCCPTPEGFAVAFNAPHRYIPGGPASPACQLWVWTLKTDPAKSLTAIELPKMEHAYLYAITLIR